MLIKRRLIANDVNNITFEKTKVLRARAVNELSQLQIDNSDLNEYADSTVSPANLL